MPIEPVSITPDVLGTYSTDPSVTGPMLDRATAPSGGFDWELVIILGAVALAAYFLLR